MKLITVKEVDAENALISININPDNQKTNMYLQYTCPNCSGYGCGRHNSPKQNKDCNGGTVTIKLDPANLDKVFDMAQLLKVKAAIQNLYLEVIGD